MKKNILFIICCLIALNLSAQRTTDEQPFGLSTGFTAQYQETITFPAPDIEEIRREDAANDQQPGPLRFAFPFHVNYTLDNSGAWQTLDDGGRLWRLKVCIHGALSTNTYYDKFWLPEGCKFFVYSEDTRQSIGAVTSKYIEGSRDIPLPLQQPLFLERMSFTNIINRHRLRKLLSSPSPV